jgi:hypothetical protein
MLAAYCGGVDQQPMDKDVNQDQKADLVFMGGGYYQVYPNVSRDGGYEFGPPVEAPLEPSEVSHNTSQIWVEDFNGDSVPDLVAADGSIFVVWYGLGNYEFVTEGASFIVYDSNGGYAGLEDYELSFFDVNKDGLADLLAARDDLFFLYVNDGTQRIRGHLCDTDAP